MGNKLKLIDSSFFKMFEYLLNFSTVYLFIFGMFLFDSLEIIVYGKGIFDTDFSIFFNFSVIPFFLLFFVTFGIIAISLSSLVNKAVSMFINWLSDRFGQFIDRLSGLESKQKIIEDSIDVSLLLETALINKDTFLLNYIEEEIKNINNVRRNHCIIYSLLISVILNWSITFLCDKKTILYFIISLYKNNGFSFINICLSLFLIPVVLTIIAILIQSITFDERKIYYPNKNI